MTRLHCRPLALLAAALGGAICLAAAPAASQPATDEVVSLGNDLIRFHAPPAADWTVRAMAKATVNSIYFERSDHKSAVEFELTAADYPLTADNAGQMAVSIAKALKEKRQRGGQEMVLPPTAEKDKRFQVVVHEQYKASGATIDSLHLMKLVGSRTVMVVASTASDDPAVAADTFAAAKDALASAKFNRKATRAKP